MRDSKKATVKVGTTICVGGSSPLPKNAIDRLGLVEIKPPSQRIATKMKLKPNGRKHWNHTLANYQESQHSQFSELTSYLSRNKVQLNHLTETHDVSVSMFFVMPSAYMSFSRLIPRDVIKAIHQAGANLDIGVGIGQE